MGWAKVKTKNHSKKNHFHPDPLHITRAGRFAERKPWKTLLVEREVGYHNGHKKAWGRAKEYKELQNDQRTDS